MMLVLVWKVNPSLSFSLGIHLQEPGCNSLFVTVLFLSNEERITHFLGVVLVVTRITFQKMVNDYTGLSLGRRQLFPYQRELAPKEGERLPQTLRNK